MGGVVGNSLATSNTYFFWPGGLAPCQSVAPDSPARQPCQSHLPPVWVSSFLAVDAAPHQSAASASPVARRAARAPCQPRPPPSWARGTPWKLPSASQKVFPFWWWTQTPHQSAATTSPVAWRAARAPCQPRPPASPLGERDDSETPQRQPESFSFVVVDAAPRQSAASSSPVAWRAAHPLLESTCCPKLFGPGSPDPPENPNTHPTPTRPTLDGVLHGGLISPVAAPLLNTNVCLKRNRKLIRPKPQRS